MELISFDEFMVRTLGGRPNQMNVGPYIGHRFDCVCGAWHPFDPVSVRVLRELPKMRLVLACPQGESVTCVKVKGIFRFKGFESLFGAKAQEEPASAVAAPAEPARLSAELDRFVHDRISHADELARRLWTNELGVDPAIQARHSLGTVVAAIATSAKDAVQPDACIDAASRFLGDSKFGAFLQEPDVRGGLRHLTRDARAAAKSTNVRQLAELVQTFLVMPSGGPSALSAAQSRAVVSCAASICADTMATSLLAP
jgi:hypothetical protein